MSKPSLWSFSGYVTEAGRRPVQDWYDGLPEEEYEELQDTLNYLADIPIWKRPEFDKVMPPLHEIQGKGISVKSCGTRIYGVFDPGVRRRFVMLNGEEAKKKSHDMSGQRLALSRHKFIKARKGIHA